MTKVDEYKRPENIKGLPEAELLEFFQWMDFKDPIGNPLTLNADFLDLIEELKLLRNGSDPLFSHGEKCPSS